MGNIEGNASAIERAKAIRKGASLGAGSSSERNAFNPVSLADIVKDTETEKSEKNRIDEIQETLGSSITEKGSEIASKSDFIINIQKHLDSMKKGVNYGYTEEIEKFGEIAFESGHLSEAIEAYDYAVTFGSKTAPKKLFELVKYIFDKPEHICDHKHNSGGCCLRGQAIKSLKSLEMIGSKELLKGYFFEIGEINERNESYHCAVRSYTLASENGSLEARKKLAELGKTLKSEFPYLALVASKFANKKASSEKTNPANNQANSEELQAA